MTDLATPALTFTLEWNREQLQHQQQQQGAGLAKQWHRSEGLQGHVDVAVCCSLYQAAPSSSTPAQK